MLLDGDFSSQLSNYLNRSDLGHSHYELQVLVTNRLAVYKTHMDFLRAGAKIIRTNTYRGSVTTLIDILDITSLEGTHLITIAVQLARKAIMHYLQENNNVPRNEQPLLAGTCGSYGIANFVDVHNCPHYWDIMPEHALKVWHKNRIQALLNAGVDMLAFDSIPSAKEAGTLIDLLLEHPQTRALITFLCSNTGILPDGTNFVEVALLFYNSLPNQIVAIGICCSSPIFATPMLRSLNYIAPPGNVVPLIVCSEKFITYNNNNNIQCDNIPNYITEWLSLGVRYIGGAGNINAYDIKDMSNVINNYNNNRIAPNALNCSLQDQKNTCISKM